MKTKISATKLLQEEHVEALAAHNWSKKDFEADIRSSAVAGYLIPLFVLQFCFERK